MTIGSTLDGIYDVTQAPYSAVAGTDCTAAVLAAQAAAMTAGYGVIYFPPNSLPYLIQPGALSATPWHIYYAGPGIFGHGGYDSATIGVVPGTSGDVFNLFGGSGGSSSSQIGAGVIGGLTIDGTGCNANCNGIHAGDIQSLVWDARVINFDAGGCHGVFFDNQAAYGTERMQGRLRVDNCDTGIEFGSPSGSSLSFARTQLDMYFQTGNPGQTGLKVSGGVYLYDCDLNVFGNFSSSATAPASQGYAIQVTGVSSGGSHSRITKSRIHVGVEAGSLTYSTTTMNFGSASNVFETCNLLLNWGNIAYWNQSNYSSNFVNCKTMQPYPGDTTLPPQKGITLTANGQNAWQSGFDTIILMGGSGYTGLTLWDSNNPPVTGNEVKVLNISGNTQTWAAQGTSHVAGGGSIAAGAAAHYVFSGTYWYKT